MHIPYNGWKHRSGGSVSIQAKAVTEAPMAGPGIAQLKSGIEVSMFWGLLGVILGAFCDKTKPHVRARITKSRFFFSSLLLFGSSRSFSKLALKKQSTIICFNLETLEF